MKTINEVPLILRREIEALILEPFLKAFAEELGEEKTREITERIISGLAEQAGREVAERMEISSLVDFTEKVLPLSARDMLEIDYEEVTGKLLRMNVTECAYARMFERLGMKELGKQLCCQRDKSFYRGLNPDIRFSRSKTILDGCDYCDFLLELPEKE